MELLPILLESASASGDGRIVFVSSAAQGYVKWKPEMIEPEEDGYSRLGTYGITKLYNVSLRMHFQGCTSRITLYHVSVILLIFNTCLFRTVMTAYALQRRLQNVNITVSSLHPGYVS